MNLDLDLTSLSNLKLAVVGHVEWVEFLQVNRLPDPGEISHAISFKETAAGGGGVAAVQMQKLTNSTVHFFTSLGNDREGIESYKILKRLGIELHVAWREKPTRRGISFVDKEGERTITVIGERLQPTAKDSLPWDILKEVDGVFITATDSEGLKLCRSARKVVATPRVKLETLIDAKIELDALIGSAFDSAEQIPKNALSPRPKIKISTEGSLGGDITPGRRYEATKLNTPIIDSYGCGDSFAAGVTAGLAANWEIMKAVNLGSNCGAKCATVFGPYI